MATIRAGSQVPICDVPVHFDTYAGCTHRCAYCFVQRKKADVNRKARPVFSESELRNFISGKRRAEVSWCDWNIPLHWGGLSDPFQPCEKHFRASYRALEIFAETGYPFLVSTKGRLVADPEYLELIGRCNAVVQISMICSELDPIEPGAPTFEERLGMLKAVSAVAKRTLVRVQPYMREHLPQILANIPRYAEAGAYGVIFEGARFGKKLPGLVRVASDFCYPRDALKADFEQLKAACHAAGLKFFAGEDRLRAMGDSLCCCGCEGVPGFIPNKFNLNHLLHGEKVEPTPGMTAPGSGFGLLHSLKQIAGLTRFKDISMRETLLREYRDRKTFYLKQLGRD